VQRKSDQADARARKEKSKMHNVRPKTLKPNGKQRNGRGFSQDELKKAGLTRVDARRMQLPVDTRRKTAHEENVEAAKEQKKKIKAEIKPTSKPEPKPVAKDKKGKPKK